MSWDQRVDIWNIGVVVRRAYFGVLTNPLTVNNLITSGLGLFQKGHLFYARDSQKQDSDANHIAEMIALLGPPPREMIQNSDYATDFFDIEGTSLE